MMGWALGSLAALTARRGKQGWVSLGASFKEPGFFKNLATRAPPASNAPVHHVRRLFGFGPVIHPLCVTTDAGMPNQAVENRQEVDLLNPQLAFTAGETHVVGSRLAGDPPRMAWGILQQGLH